MKIVVTGNLGFIGSHLSDKLVELGHEVIGIDDYSTGLEANQNPMVKTHFIDIGSIFALSQLIEVFEGCDYVFHCAAKARVQPSFKEPVKYHKTNVNGTLNCLEAARISGIKRFIYSSSSSVYGDAITDMERNSESDEPSPMSPYALTKLQGEQWCQHYAWYHDLPTISLRYFCVYGDRMIEDGPYKSALGAMLKCKRENSTFQIYGTGHHTRDFTFVGDVVDANIMAMNNPFEGRSHLGQIYNIGSGKDYSIQELCEFLKLKTESIPGVKEPFSTLSDNKLAAVELGWKPTMELTQWLKTKI